MSILSSMKKNNENSNAYMRDFQNRSLELAVKRIKIVSAAMVMLSIYLFINDYIMLTSISNVSYRGTLFIIHLIIFIVAFIFLVLVTSIKKYNSEKWLKIKWIIVYAFICFSITLGIAVSLNSTKLNTNIYTYITIIMFLCVFIPSNRAVTTLIIMFYHIVFLSALSFFIVNKDIVLVNKINGTVSVVVSIVILFTFYNFRKNEFINEKKLIERERNMTKLFEINPMPLMLVNLLNSNIVMVNKKSIEYFNIISEVMNFNNLGYTFANEEDRLKILDMARKNGTVDGYTLEIVRNGAKNWIMCNCEILNYNEQEHMLVGIIDITKIKVLENDLYKKASIDPLTGMMNRSRGIELSEMLYNSMKLKNKYFTVIFCDINSLKMVNDLYGHSEGDKLINVIGESITKVLDSNDFAFRYGGDEFIIIIPDNNELECEIKIKEAQTLLNEYKINHLKPYDISISYGIAIMDADLKLDELITLADKKMYINKLEYYKNMQPL